MLSKKKQRSLFAFNSTKLIFLFSILLFSSILFCSCESTTQLISQDIDTVYKSRSINNILIFGYQAITKQNIIRKEFASRLKKYGIKTFSLEDIFGKESYLRFENGYFENENKKRFSDSVLTILKSKNIDIVLFYSQNEYGNGIVNVPPSYNRTKFTGSWTYTYNETNFIYRNAILSGYPLEFKIEKIYTSSYFVDVNLDKSICYFFTTTDKINSSSDFHKITRSYTKLIVQQMKINHLINN